MKVHCLFLSCFSLLSLAATAQKNSGETVFEVKKKTEKPILLQWAGIDTCYTDRIYFLTTGKMVYDSISLYKMDFRIEAYCGEPYYYFWKTEVGKAYAVIWTRNKKTGVLAQTYVKPLYFITPP